MKPFSILLVVFACLFVSCRKEEPKVLTAGFSASNADSTYQGSTDTTFIRISLNDIADRDVYIKYFIQGGEGFALNVDTTYFLIRKGEQHRSLPVVTTNRIRGIDLDMHFSIDKVYNAGINKNASKHTLKLKYHRPAGTGTIKYRNIWYSTSLIESSGGYSQYDGQFIYTMQMIFSNNMRLTLRTFIDPTQRTSFEIDPDFSNSITTARSSFIDSTFNNYSASGGSINILNLDVLHKTMDVEFKGYYQNDTISGTFRYAYYNFTPFS